MMGTGGARSLTRATERAIAALRRAALIVRVSAGRWLLVLGVLAVTAGMGYAAPRLNPKYTLAAALGVPAVVIVASQLPLGIPAMVLTALVVRFSLPTGTESRIVASLLVTAGVFGFWIVRMALLDRRVRLRPSRANAPLLAFVGITVVSYLWSNAFRDPMVVAWRTWPLVQLGAMAVMVLLPGAFWLTANLLPNRRWIEALAAIMIVAGMVATVKDYLALPLAFLQVRPLFPMWFAALACSQGLYNRRLPPAVRGLLLLAVAAHLYYLVFGVMSWVSAWLPPALALMVVVALRSRPLLMLMIVAAIVLVGVNVERLQIAVAEERQTSLFTRLDAYAVNWRVTGKHILFGTGPAGYAVYYMSYFPELAMATHSNYLDILSQTGILGLLAFLVFLVAMGRLALDLWGNTRGRRDFSEGFAAAYAGGLAAMLVAAALGDWVVPFVYTQTIAGFDYALYTWVMLGAAQALHYFAAASNAKGAT
jgi:O-antigen ligase